MEHVSEWKKSFCILECCYKQNLKKILPACFEDTATEFSPVSDAKLRNIAKFREFPGFFQILCIFWNFGALFKEERIFSFQCIAWPLP